MCKLFFVPNLRTNNRLKRSLAYLLAGLLTLNTHSLQATENALTLPAAVKRALEKNPALRVFEFRDQALAGELFTAGLRPSYELGIESENFAGSGDLKGFDQAELTVALSSTIEMGEKRNARIAVASRGRSRLDAQMQVESLALLGEITRRYIDVLAAQERVTLAIKANTLAKDTLTEVTKRVKAGATPEAEVKRAQAAASQAHLTVLSEQSQLKYLKVALSSLWSDSAPDFTQVEGDLYRFGEDVTFEDLYARVERNPSVQIFAAEQRLKEAEMRLAKTQASTDVSWSVGLRRFQGIDDTAVVAGFSMPLFSGRRSKGAIQSATAASNEVFVRKEAALLALRTQLYRAYSNRKQAVHTVDDLRKDIVPALEQALKDTRLAYQRGRYSYIDYVSARQELLSARRAQIDAATAALRYGADIEQLTAEPLSADQYLSQNFSGQMQ